MKIVSPAEWITQPWRNGGGVTHEVFREASASERSDTFTLRVSVAEVTRDGPFSRFEGIDRWITLLEGHGFTLHREGGPPRVIDRAFEPFAFPGEAAIDCTLIDGPVRDLNVMADRARRDVRVAVLAPSGGALVVGAESIEGAKLLVFVLEGSIEVRGTTLARHALMITEARGIELVGAARLMVIWATPIR
ncbi:MAG: HutD family protein [Deltaproteobacteria bacterium]|nr:HutD family protein [Deltaproteobacteria bacterium]